MEFALVDGERRKPTTGRRGVCQCCGAAMIAKCGRIKMWHWAHWPRTSCEPWWGGETKWHREWKGRFPEAWREIVQIDDRTGEKHIADLKTPSDLVIEFQHSPLGDLELLSREIFYEDMIWVVVHVGRDPEVNDRSHVLYPSAPFYSWASAAGGACGPSPSSSAEKSRSIVAHSLSHALVGGSA